MSRHRAFKNQKYSYGDDDDEYYDEFYGDEDDYYDEEEYHEEQQAYRAPERTTTNLAAHAQQQQQQQQKQATPAPASQLQATTTTAGAPKRPTAPPPGWSPPSPSGVPAAAGAKSAAAATSPARPVAPPPGWTRPSTTTTTAATTKKSAAAGGGVVASIGGSRSRSRSPPPPSGVSASKKPGGGGGGGGGGGRPLSPVPGAGIKAVPPPKPPTSEDRKGGRSRLSMVVLGHVDAGKSTLMGQVLVKVGKVEQRQVNKYQRQAAELGKASFALAWVLDEDESERARGVTMDVATKTIVTPRHDVTILDAPGHRDFIPAMIGGAASADVGLLVVAATTGEFESGFDLGGQTREHIVLSRGLGVSQLVVAVNKLDASDPPWGEDRFESIKGQLLPFLTVTCGFQPKRIRFVPVSGLTGENIKESSEDALSWYQGPTLLEAIDDFMPAQRNVDKPLRLIVNDVYPEGKGVTVRGRVVQGLIRVNETVVALPIGDVATVNRIDHGELEVAVMSNVARAGDNVEVALNGIDIARIQPGFVVCHANEELRVPVRTKVQAKILVMDKIPVPIIRGSQVTLHMHSVDVPAVISKLVSTVKRGAGGDTSLSSPDAGGNAKKPPRVLTGGSSATVEITMGEKMCLEEFSQCRSLGRFVLRRGGESVAVGVVEKLLE